MAETLNTAEAIEALRVLLEGSVLTLDLPGVGDARRERVELIDQIDDYLLPRLRRVDAPLLAVLGGSTGAGKSTITNSLVGDAVTLAGVLRPTTRAPVLVCHPEDLPWFADADGVLAGLPRSTGATAVGEIGLRLVPSEALSPGLAILDAPDIDSVEVANHDLAAQLLGAADLWIFVTTAARYADAVPWEYLGLAQERSAALAVVINRIPPGSEEEVRHHFQAMLSERGLGATTVFAVAERELEDDRIGEELDPVRDWLQSLAADAVERQSLVRSTLDGALASLPDRVERVAAALDEQSEQIGSLEDFARRRYARALVDIDMELDRGTLLRGEVLDQWREFVGTGALMSKLESGVSKVRDTLRGIFSKAPSHDEQATGQLESNLLVVTRDAVDRAALDIVDHWEQSPAGQHVLTDAPRSIERAGTDLTEKIEHELRAWEQYVLDLVREQSGDKVVIARTVSTGINGVGVALMIAVFSQTGGLTGGEAAVAGGTAAVSQAVLTAVFGEQAIRDLARDARENLITRIEGLLDHDIKRFESLVGGASMPGDDLRASIHNVATASE